MNFLEIILIAVGLSMDAFAVSVCGGLAIKNVKIKDAVKTGLFFGGFQALMPVLGYFLGSSFKNLISDYDHWIALLLLGAIGGKMIYEGVKGECDVYGSDFLKFKRLLFLAVATSIDALAVGITFSVINVSLLFPAVIIGLTTFIFSFNGIYIGKKFGCYFGKSVEVVGGIILIGIGIKIVIEHLINNI